MGDLGGQPGLFTGASVIPVSEFLKYFIVETVLIIGYYTRGKRRQENQTSDVTPAVKDEKRKIL